MAAAMDVDEPTTGSDKSGNKKRFEVKKVSNYYVQGFVEQVVVV